MASRAALAATRSLDVLGFLASHPGQAHTLTELAHGLGVNPSSMHGILGVMTEAGYLSRHPFHKTYRLGPVAAAVGQAAVQQNPLLELASEEVVRLTNEFDIESVVLTTVGDEMVVVARSGPPVGRFLSFVGQRWHHAAPMGSIFVAWAGDAAAQRWFDASDHPLEQTERAHYREVLERVRADGHAAVVIEENSWKLGTDANGLTKSQAKNPLITAFTKGQTYRIFYIGQPVFDAFGEVALGLFVNGPSARLALERVDEFSQRLADVAARIMKRTGGRPPSAAATEPRSRASAARSRGAATKAKTKAAAPALGAGRRRSEPSRSDAG